MTSVVVFGGSGRLGSALRRVLSQRGVEVHAPSHAACDIADPGAVAGAIARHRPQIIVNCAALVGLRECDRDRDRAWQVNVVGALNVARAAHASGARHVFLSSAAVFDGRDGRYREDSTPNPTYFYAVTKVAAECGVRMTDDHLIIRLDFFDPIALKYRQVFGDHYTSKVHVRDAAEMVATAALRGWEGTLHVGGPRDSLFNILQPFAPDLEEIRIADSSMPDFPRDISLDISRWTGLVAQPDDPT